MLVHRITLSPCRSSLANSSLVRLMWCHWSSSRCEDSACYLSGSDAESGSQWTCLLRDLLDNDKPRHHPLYDNMTALAKIINTSLVIKISNSWRQMFDIIGKWTALWHGFLYILSAWHTCCDAQWAFSTPDTLMHSRLRLHTDSQSHWQGRRWQVSHGLCPLSGPARAL